MTYYESSFLAGYKKRFNTYKGLSSGDFKSGQCSVAEGIDKIRQNLVTLLSVNQGDIFFNPSFGASLQPYLFEPNDFILKDTLDRILREQIRLYSKDIKVENIDIKIQDLNIFIEISYYVTTFGVHDVISIIKKRGVFTYD